MKIDLNKHYAYDYLSGTGNGPWYSGDTAWLSKSVQGKTVLEHLTTAATNWKQRNSSDNLADYGENKNLLEVIKRYTHKVPSLNAANVWINRTVAQMHRIQGNTKRAAELEADAQKILDAVKTLYVSGEGVWNAKTPAGLQQNRHVYDLAVILNTIGDDLTQEQKKEMVRFFQTELQTPTWMRALSNKDVGIGESIRADHQNTGAYISWPGLTLLGLYKNGFHTDASAWLGAGKEVGLHQVVRQGQLGQAYWHGAADGTSGNKTINGVAQKASYEYFELKNGTPDFSLNNWAEVGSGIYPGVIIEGLFGLRASLDTTVSAAPHLEFDQTAELRNIVIKGQQGTITAKGFTAHQQSRDTCTGWRKKFNSCKPFQFEEFVRVFRCELLGNGTCNQTQTNRNTDVNEDSSISLKDLEHLRKEDYK